MNVLRPDAYVEEGAWADVGAIRIRTGEGWWQRAERCRCEMQGHTERGEKVKRKYSYSITPWGYPK
jgi:hypothetical protein